MPETEEAFLVGHQSSLECDECGAPSPEGSRQGCARCGGQGQIVPGGTFARRQADLAKMAAQALAATDEKPVVVHFFSNVTLQNAIIAFSGSRVFVTTASGPVVLAGAREALISGGWPAFVSLCRLILPYAGAGNAS